MVGGLFYCCKISMKFLNSQIFFQKNANNFFEKIVAA